MAKAKAPSKQPGKLSREDKLKILKRNKLFTGSTKISGGKATGAQKRALSKFALDIPGLASGKIKTLDTSKVARGKQPKYLKGTSKRVLVPVESGKERPYINKKTGQVSVVLKSHGKKYRQIFYNPTMDLGKLPRGKNLRYQVQFNNWGSDSTMFSSVQLMADFMHPYEVRAKNPWKDWILYVSVLQIIKPKANDDEEEDEE